ncbi:OmpA family protein [Mucilaginibacter paludis]|uniref:OmpA/MotB domain protein n=1 Tax=Mucilaginibacter paludis DSM 18603 TaxID=714943 RepID=H1Y0E8_9SPHI|nr:OmpA family protein [Mucilaginibacter paludis]EHQ28197.1 OmpA/MotB domain protein [Mucilaginibacter paludis DSM 18603]
MLKKIYFTLALLMFARVLLFAQDDSKTNSLFKAGESDYNSFKYAPAIVAFETLLKANPQNKEAQAMLADSYRQVKDYDKAVFWYGKLTTGTRVRPEWALRYAEVLANKKQYESSELWYEKYLNLVNKNKMASSFIKFYPNIGSLLEENEEWKVYYTNISTASSEYSPMYYKEGLVFASNRKGGPGFNRKIFQWDQSPFSDLYYVKNLSDIKAVDPDSLMDILRRGRKASGKKGDKENEGGIYTTNNDNRMIGLGGIKTFKDTLGDYLSKTVKVLPVPGKINTKYHEGSATMLPDGSMMFTRNNYLKGKYAESDDGINKLQIYIAKGSDFNDIQAFTYNNDQYSVGHPTVNSLGTLLIFSSDMPGQGGTDLYYCIRSNARSEWSRPKNMGPVINTEGNEMFPTLYQDSILYFSSTGHPGLGGLDIFKVTLKGPRPINSPANLGAPVNSSVDDFGLIRSEDGASGFFSSNRRGSDDIYGFTYQPFNLALKGLVVDADSGQPIPNSYVAIRSKNNISLKTNAQGGFSKSLNKETDYSLSATKDGYSTDEGTVTTKGIVSDTTLTITLRISKKAQDQQFDGPKKILCDSLRELFSIGKIYYDLDKSFIRPDAEGALNHLINLLNSYPGLKVIVASHCDTRASIDYNIGLSQRRSLSARAYLLAHGVSENRIQMEYFGKSRLANKCADGVPCTEADHQLNRRTEFVLLKNGKELQDMDCDWLQRNLKKK